MRWGRTISLATSLSILALSAANAAEARDPAGEAPDQSLGGNAIYGLGALVGSLVYAPIKLVVALGGTLGGGLAWAFSGGNDELAGSIIRPSLTGDSVLTPDHLRGFAAVELLSGTREDPHTHYYAFDDRLPPLRFAVGDAKLGGNQERVLGEVATTLSTCPKKRFRLEGHADAQGEGPYNFTLSLERAKTVKDYRVDSGVPPGRLEAAGLGETEPASLNDTDSGWVDNRQFEEWEFIHPRSEKLRVVDIEENVLVK